MNLDDSYEVEELPAPPRKSIPEADRQLLELAARALGAQFEEVDGEGYGNLHFEDGSVVNAWNPLQFSGDALDLAVNLEMHVDTWPDSVEVFFGEEGSVYEGYDQLPPILATRRAITRAAAEIGKTKL
jgi:hypothetical protein